MKTSIKPSRSWSRYELVPALLTFALVCLLSLPPIAADVAPEISIEQDGSKVDVRWTDESGTHLERSNALSEWDRVPEGEVQIDPAPDGRRHTVDDPDGKGFFRLVTEVDPAVAFAENFDGGGGPALPSGWTSGGASLSGGGITAWELGSPSSAGPGAAPSPPNCVGTDLDDDYESDTDIWLRTPPIDLTAAEVATLSFKEFRDIGAGPADGDSGTLRILAADDFAVLSVLEAEVKGQSGGWVDYSTELLGAAFDEPVVVEFQFQSNSDEVVGLTNGGFEDPAQDDGGFTSDQPPGWDMSGSGGVWDPDSSDGYPGGQAAEGQNVGWISNGYFEQAVNANLQANTTYTLTAEVGNPNHNNSNNTDDYRFELRAGGAVVESQQGSTPDSGEFQSHTMVYDSGPNPGHLGQALTVRLIATGGDELSFDDVSFSISGGGGPGQAGWYLDEVEVRLESPGGWRVLTNSPVSPLWHHDDLFFIDEDTGWLCNISGEIWKTTDAGESWTRVLSKPETAFRTITFLDEMNGWVGNLGPGDWVGGLTDTNPLYATTDGGITWTPVSMNPKPDGICGLYAVGPDTIHGAGRYAGDSYFISSTDGGATWVSRDLSMDYSGFVDVFFHTPEIGYVTATNNSNRAELLYTTDGGANWTTVKNNVGRHYWKMDFASETFGFGVVWSGPDADKWIQTYDGGTTWTDRVFEGGCQANGIGFYDEQTGWIGCDYPEPRTLETTDGGDSWHWIRIDPDYDDQINKFLRVGDAIYGVGYRVLKWTPPTTAAAAAPAGRGARDGPDKFDNSLCSIAARPNPSTGGTSIRYTVPEDDKVQITICKRGGLIEYRPVDEHQAAGTYTIEFTASEDDPPVLYAIIVTGRYRQVATFYNQPSDP